MKCKWCEDTRNPHMCPGPPRIDVEASEKCACPSHMKHEGGCAMCATAIPSATALDRLLVLLEECRALVVKKNADYGRENDPFANVKASEEFGVPPWVGAMIRLNDKVRRLQALANGSPLANEGARDSFMDIAVYSLIACVLYEDDVE